MDYSKLKVGDKILVGGDSGFCNDDEETITKIYKKYDENTGKPYNVICCGDWEFSGKEGCGGAMNYARAYYIKSIIKDA